MIDRVALVSPYDWSQNGGVTEHVRQLTSQLRQRNIDVTIIAPSSQPDLIEPGLVSLGSVVPVPINGSVARTTLSPAVIDNVHTLLARTKFDVIHLHEPLAPMLPLSVLNASPSPNVGTFHASGQRSLGYAASRKLLDWLAQRLTVRVAVSQAAARFAQQYFAGEYTIIPNGVDPTQFNVNVEPFSEWRNGRPTVLFVGRFEEPRKGFTALLAAFTKVQQALPAAQLLVVGRGDPAVFQAQECSVHSLHFLGPVSAAALPRYYRSADVVCAPSTGQESFGIILVEAMSSGCPIVATNIEGYSQVLTHRREGLLVPPNHPDALAVALLQVLGDRQLQQAFSLAGPTTAARYAWPDVSDRIIEVYERARTRAGLTSPTYVSLPAPRLLPGFDPLLTAHGTVLLACPVVQSAPKAIAAGTEGVEYMLTEPFEARVRAVTQRVVGRVLGRSGISPNVLTILGFLLTLCVTITLASGHLFWGGVLVLLTSAFDMFDGALARATKRNSTFGAFFDSTIDRYAEAFIFLGLLLHYQRVPASQFEISFVYLAIIGSLMVSYTRARAEALGIECKVGILARPERIILLSLGLMIGWLPFTLAVLALFTNITAMQRIYHVWVQTEGKQAHSPEMVKSQRRGWFASRDQSPS